jgi:DNA (cytosine-5)-methyltransferase 1
MRELIIDLFAGGGGASEGIERALGLAVDVAINHDEEAIRMHWLNHPKTRHIPEDIWKVAPLKVTGGRPVGLLWASPDCTHHSRAKGGKPRDSKKRCLADVVVDWARLTKPRIIILENVPEFTEWGPLDKKGQPIKDKKGLYFQRWYNNLCAAGYQAEWRYLKACDYGVPTSRKRWFLIARCDGHPIVWPEPTHGHGLKPYRTAAECIDFYLPCPSIFLSKKEAKQLGFNVQRPLKEKTLRRIAKGIFKFVINSGDPFIIGIDQQNSQSATWPASEPLRTITTENRFAVVAPFLSKYHGQKAKETRGQVCDEPLRTQDTQNRFALVSAFLSKYYGGVVGADCKKPLPTVTAIDHNALVATHLTKFWGTNIGSDMREPVPTITGQGQHIGEVRAFLIKYYDCGTGQSLREPLHTVTSKGRIGLVTIHGQTYQIADIGMRMLRPRELARAQGFPDSYILTGTNTNQVAKIGNSVCPPIAEALVAANVTIMEVADAATG